MGNLVFNTFLLVWFVGPACLVQAGDARGAGKPNQAVSVRAVLPSATDNNIDKFSGNGWEHRVYVNPAVPKKHQLVVFLAGTGGKGTGAKDFCTLAANEGFHVVSLAYPSSVSISEFRTLPDPDVFLKARENIIYGKVPFKNLGVNEANSIHNRLIKLLQYLNVNHPPEKWGQYLTKKGALVWSKLILSGQSQGGGHAALMGMQHEVARVLMFGSPKDFNTHFNQPAKWLSGPNATPLERFFSFVHRADEKNGGSYAQMLENYRALKLLPKYQVINVDEVPAPYQHSRLLTSKRADVQSPHGAVIGNIVYKGVWKYMLEEAVQ